MSILTGAVAALLAIVTAQANPAVNPVAAWIERNIEDPSALGRAVAGAEIAGLGEAAHRLAEITTLKHDSVRQLVERQGFRPIAWEEDWSLGTQIDDYVLGRRDDRDALAGQMSRTAWRTAGRRPRGGDPPGSTAARLFTGRLRRTRPTYPR